MSEITSTPQAPAVPPAFAGAHEPKALPFDPAKLEGLSERLIRSHWENNYIGSVKALNMIETRLAAALADPDLPIPERPSKGWSKRRCAAATRTAAPRQPRRIAINSKGRPLSSVGLRPVSRKPRRR